MKLTKRFYVASQSMNPNRYQGKKDKRYMASWDIETVPAPVNNHYDRWAHETLEQAIEHATKLAQESEQDQLVVQIIKIVRPQRIPVTVEDVE